MACKIYAHLEVDGFEPIVAPIEIPKPEEMQFGTLKDAFIKYCARQNKGVEPMGYDQCCFWNQDDCPIADRASVALFAWEYNDFFLKQLPERNDHSALSSSQKERGELSYYYAHNRGHGSLVSKPQTLKSVQTQPSAAPTAPTALPSASAVSSGVGHFNTKQSPFGTDITGYETITTYTWEDHASTVKVLLPLEGVGKLPADSVKSKFGLRSFEILVNGYEGKNLRFATFKTHGELQPEECKHNVRANRVTVVLKKAKDDDIWYDLMKKRAIGDDDDP
mmetsp:Transcript_36652/g.77897  ORF Transcript_36652/g.77897 Transcript_36652/m.77897 type:complete len:278 (-) Transcript_36652:27-860(-)